MSIEWRLLRRAWAMTALVLMVAPMLAACGGERTATPAQAATATTAAAAPTATQATAAPARRQQSVLAVGWNRIDPGGNTICARGTPYAFWARPGTANKLLIYFQEGGVCWDYDTCEPHRHFFNDSIADSFTHFSDPSYDAGILDLTNPNNPFKDYNIVYVPYCTGDVHMGSYTQTYTSTVGYSVTIHHNGYINSSTAVEWAYSHFASPESVFVIGCSAGGIGSIVFAPYIIKHYDQARVVQMGDSGAYVFDHAVDLQTNWHAHDNFPNWIPGVAKIKPGNFTMSAFYAAIAQYYPNSIFSQYNTAHDSVQQRYYVAEALPGKTLPPWEEAFRQSLAEIHSAAPNFRSYTAGGSEHGITPSPRFYTETKEGISFRDWVNSLANATPVANVGN